MLPSRKRRVFGESGIPAAHAQRVKQLVVDIIGQLQATINIVNFWNNAPEVARLRGEMCGGGK